MGKDAPKISVIVPMYNAEKYLSLCIDTILRQTFKDFELILIDDCSTDNTLEVARSFDDSRIRILQNEKNLGMPGAVRNVGLDAAQGDYIYFCDDDDVLLKNGLEKMYAASENSMDIVNTVEWYIAKNPEFQDLNGLKVTKRKISNSLNVSPDLKTRINQEFLEGRMHIAPWLFLYRRKFLMDNAIRFPAEVAEDIFFNFGAICATGKITKIEFPFYVYRKHQNSATNSVQRLQKNFNSLIALIEYLDKKLANLPDIKFVQDVKKTWARHFSASYLFRFVNSENPALISEIFDLIKERFGKDAVFVMTLFNLHIEGIRSMQDNQNLRSEVQKISLENQKLKTTLENINEQIIEVLKV